MAREKEREGEGGRKRERTREGGQVRKTIAARRSIVKVY